MCSVPLMVTCIRTAEGHLSFQYQQWILLLALHFYISLIFISTF